jgi:hypothetical protein
MCAVGSGRGVMACSCWSCGCFLRDVRPSSPRELPRPSWDLCLIGLIERLNLGAFGGHPIGLITRFGQQLQLGGAVPVQRSDSQFEIPPIQNRRRRAQVGLNWRLCGK